MLDWRLRLCPAWTGFPPGDAQFLLLGQGILSYVVRTVQSVSQSKPWGSLACRVAKLHLKLRQGQCEQACQRGARNNEHRLEQGEARRTA